MSDSATMAGRARPVVLVINGPNLNMLGTRQPEVYGHDTLDDVERLCRETAAPLGVEIDFRQSNSESEIIGWIQSARTGADAILINPAGFTSTSIAILDALLTFEGPIFECHISPLFRREEFRHLSYVSKAATAKIEGFGISGYGFAVARIAQLLKQAA
ncbi:type II 3-dehydroquinate dehydratase [Wenxinia marina]|uniref:3-dehydroquinate dehydratase n=1 Tax=Wenxinia marina DSM 24838 TaxID=1123501 RepID=A0A0D0NGP8_9RHOB|nr:type II 3-dehydroquinate dehydratase [Wenxinia marina]KIQ67500.1 3-dehydroquinate dehydratase [Wenxinia marina DSM 24838]GGL69045.1 3-dehydroquinate dehydratase 2 [Wenxinia marina]